MIQDLEGKLGDTPLQITEGKGKDISGDEDEAEEDESEEDEGKGK